MIMANNYAHGFLLTLKCNLFIYAFFRILTSGPAEKHGLGGLYIQRYKYGARFNY
jgi:hypothetical protein